MAREKHQNGWVEDSGKRVKKWIGHSGIEFDRKVLWVYDQYGDPTVRTMNCQDAPFSRRGAKHRSAGLKEMLTAELWVTHWFWDNIYLPSR